MSEREWRKSREIVERIVVEGELILLTPTSLGNGDANGLTDIPLLLDEVEGKALLTGTSIAGALRNYLRECFFNYGISEESQYKDDKGKRLKDANGKELSLPIITQLFGSLEDDGAQSYLIVDDSIGGEPQTELRDGVRIDGTTRTAIDKAKFDLELLEAGMTFPLRFELLITQDQESNKAKLISAFATALQGFENSEIFLGARKRRGYGECKVEKWRVKVFDLIDKDKNDLVDWLKNGAENLANLEVPEQNSILTALSVSATQDQRESFELNACFALDGSILIRSGSKLDAAGNAQPDAVHLRSKRNGNSQPIVSGTSLAGVLRHRALRIANTINLPKDFVEKIFGVDMDELKERNKTRKQNGLEDEQPFASRLEVAESVIDAAKTNSLVQTRVKIDRFTGGAFEGALFDAAPVFAKSGEQALAINLKLRNPKKCEIGLLLLLLKDLWTSDLTIGGESSIGRGRLKGLGTELNYKNGDNRWLVKLKGDASDTASVVIEEYFEQNGAVKTDKKDEGYRFLNKFVDDLNTKNWETEASDVG